MQVDAPFETIFYCGFEWWNNCVQTVSGLIFFLTEATEAIASVAPGLCLVPFQKYQ